MFNEIAWSDYLTAVLFILIIYYTVVFVIFFPQEIKDFMGSRSLIGREALEAEQVLINENDLSDLNATVVKVNEVLMDARIDAEKSELLFKLRKILREFNGLTVPAFRVAIYNHIISESAAQCRITISEEELVLRG